MVVSNTTTAVPDTMNTGTNEKGFLDGKSDLYEGHKVVAMPNSSFGGMTVRDVVSSRNTPGRLTDYRNRTPTRRRSGSLGKSKSPVSRSRDIVQDVYNRIGVNYIRGRPSIESLLDKEEGAPTPPLLTDDPVRPTSRGRNPTRSAETNGVMGRSEQETEDGRPRPRSLSNGRGVTARWPHDSPAAISVRTISSPQPTGAVFAHSAPLVDAAPTSATSPQMKERSTYSHQRRSTPQPLNSSFGARPAQADMKKRQSYHPEMRDEQADEEHVTNREMRELEELRDSVSVKDMISDFLPSENKSLPPPSGRSSIRRIYNNQFNKRDLPPKVDIYETSKVSNEAERDTGASATGSVGDGSVEAARECEQNNIVIDKKRFSSGNSISARSMRSSQLADAFLAAISPSKPIPPPSSPSPLVSRNIPMSAELNVPVDAASVAASSVSGEDFDLSPRKKHGKSFSGGIPKFGAYSSGHGNEKLERYIDDRIQGQVAAMAKSVEVRFEQKYRGRIEELERQTDSLTTLVSKLL